MADYTTFYEFGITNDDWYKENYHIFNQFQIPNLKNIAPNYEVRWLKRANFEDNKFCLLWNEKDKSKILEVFNNDDSSLFRKCVWVDWEVQVYEDYHSKVRNIVDVAVGLAYAKEIGFWGKNSYYWHKLPQEYITTQKQYKNALKCAKNTFLELPFEFQQGKHLICVAQ